MKPAPFQERKVRNENFTLHLYSKNFAQGDVIYFELLPPDSAGSFPRPIRQILFEGKNIPVTKKEWGYRGFIGIHPEIRIGKRIIQVRTGEDDNNLLKQNVLVAIKDTAFPVYRSALKLGKYSNSKTARSPEVQKEIAEGRAIKHRVFTNSGEDMIGSRFAFPRDFRKVTSPFYAIRMKEVYKIVNGKKVLEKPRKNVHRGLDLKGKAGNPIYAIADGKVVLARKLYYEGKFTVIDHGDSIYSLYMHQSKQLVQEGEMVHAGDLIGEPGATGAVTGAHLHVALYMHGVVVNPESLLGLPIR